MKTRNIVMIVLLVSIMPVMGIAMGQFQKSKQVANKLDIYYCPMHPNVFYNHPGNCPICGMALIKK